MIFETFRDTHKNGTVNMPGGEPYEMRKVHEDSRRALHGKFKKAMDGKRKKKNFNYILAFVNMLYRQTDWDVRDLNIRDLTGQFPQVVNLVKLASRTYLKDIEFDLTMNKFRRELISMGHLIIKIVNGEPVIVPLDNVIIPADSEGIQKSGLIEIQYKTYEEMQVYKDDMTDEQWETVEELKKTFDATGNNKYAVLDYWVYDKFTVGGKEKLTKGCHRYLDTTYMGEVNSESIPSFKFDSFASPHKKERVSKALQKKLGKYERIYPYLDAKFIEIPGRYWGAGVAELLKDLSIYSNKILNIKESFDELQLRGILVHTKNDMPNAKSLSQKLVNNLETGFAVSLNAEEKLERLNLGSTTFDTLQMLDKLFELMRVFIGVNQQSTGEHSPSTVTATVGRINQQNAATTYEVVKEVQAIYLTKLFRDFLQEEIIMDLTEEEVVALSGNNNEIAELDKFFITQMVYREAHEAVMQPTEEEVNNEIARRTEEVQMNGGTRFAQLTKELLGQLKFIIEFQVGDQDFERQSRITALLEMARDPQYTGSRNALYTELRDLLGLTGSRYEKTQQEVLAEQEQMRAEEAAKVQTPLPPEQTLGNQIGQAA